MRYQWDKRDNPLALVVDDDFSLRISMGAALEKAGFEVVEADNGLAALPVFEEKKPDLVLLDVVMPKMDGFETCAAIRKLPGGEFAQILMVTGLNDFVSTEKAFEAGANDFVSKPINWVMLGHRGKYMLRAGRAFQDLIMSRRRLAKTQELAKLGNWQIHIASGKFHCSHEACRILGLEGFSEVGFSEFLSPIPPQEQGAVKEKIHVAVERKRSLVANYRALLPDGSCKHILNQGEVLYDSGGMPEIMLGVVQDVTRLKEAEEEIRLLAFYDGLTGLANRMLFLDRLDMEIENAKRHQYSFALLFMDLDQFKRVNDTLGHHIGDLLLKCVAETIQTSIRSTDTVARSGVDHSDSVIARLGGDEFTVLLSRIRDPESAATVARRLLQELQTTYDLDGHEVSVTASIGISVFPADGMKSETLMKNADSAMYHAKNSGRNSFQFYMESFNKAVVERFSIEGDLKKALVRNEFVLYYQPQVALATREIVGAEALIRWLHPQKGLIAPSRFIHIAEELGLIIDINKWVLTATCKQIHKWRRAGIPLVRVAVNLSGYRLADQNIVSTIRGALDAYELDADALEVEITENILMQNTDDTILTLEQMKDMRLRIALDDFGTGYSSLSYLTNFPVDSIKIDRSFVMGCAAQSNNMVVIKAIIAMGHSLDKKIVAEGIETQEQYELLKAYGCDEAQGFYFKPPVPQAEFARLMKKGTL